MLRRVVSESLTDVLEVFTASIIREIASEISVNFSAQHPRTHSCSKSEIDPTACDVDSSIQNLIQIRLIVPEMKYVDE
jgi:hypothetical protein